MGSSRKKIDDLMRVVREALESENFIETVHVQERKSEREIFWSEVEDILQNGFHESKKDKFEKHYSTWSYAIRGKTTDGRDLRVIVTFEDSILFIVTAMDVKGS